MELQLEPHDRIVQAIARGDRDEAARAMHAPIGFVHDACPAHADSR